MNHWDDMDGIVKTPKGQKALAKLKEADELYADSQRITRAVREGLLPYVTAAEAEAIEKQVEHLGDKAAYHLDVAEGWSY